MGYTTNQRTPYNARLVLKFFSKNFSFELHCRRLESGTRVLHYRQ